MHCLPPGVQATLLHAHSPYMCVSVLVCVCACVLHVHAVDMEMCVPLVPSYKTKCVLGDARVDVREFQLKKEIPQTDFWNGEMASRNQRSGISSASLPRRWIYVGPCSLPQAALCGHWRSELRGYNSMKSRELLHSSQGRE